VFILGQALGVVIYLRNLQLIFSKNSKDKIEVKVET